MTVGQAFEVAYQAVIRARGGHKPVIAVRFINNVYMIEIYCPCSPSLKRYNINLFLKALFENLVLNTDDQKEV